MLLNVGHNSNDQVKQIVLIPGQGGRQRERDTHTERETDIERVSIFTVIFNE